MWSRFVEYKNHQIWVCVFPFCTEATKKNGGSLGHLKFNLCKWPKRKKLADRKCKFQHGKWRFDIWKWPNRKKKLNHHLVHLSLLMNGK